eukprot:scaffold1746_cov245-Chaetoceros_neogracile.AAC.2
MTDKDIDVDNRRPSMVQFAPTDQSNRPQARPNRGFNDGRQISEISMNINRDPSNRSTLDGSHDDNVRHTTGVGNRTSGNRTLVQIQASEAEQGSLPTPTTITELSRPDGPLGDFRLKCGKFINHPYAEHFITFIIFCNTVLLVLYTFEFAREERVKNIFEALDYTFLGIFTFESMLQLIYYDVKLLKNKWLSFDLILVIASWVFQTFTVLRCLRILKIASKFEALQRLITALLDVIPNITAIFSLLLLVFYIFAVMFTTLFKDLELSRDYFSRLDKTLFSLFQFMTMDWQEAARECAVFLPWAPLLFVLFEIVSGFIVFNLIVAVLCEALGLLEKDSEEEEMQRQIEEERIDSMNSLLERIEMIKTHQLKIQQTLREVANEKKD